MRIPKMPSRANRERGGITILVSIVLLSLLTVSAIGMSKNSMREVIIQGTSRQGGEIRHVADTGLHWTLYWVSPATERPAASGVAELYLLYKFKTLAADTTQMGVVSVLSPVGNMVVETTTDYSKKYTLGITYMGKLKDIRNTSVGQVAEPMKPDLWSVRSDASLAYTTSGLTFVHARETWFSLPSQGSGQ